MGGARNKDSALFTVNFHSATVKTPPDRSYFRSGRKCLIETHCYLYPLMTYVHLFEIKFEVISRGRDQQFTVSDRMAHHSPHLLQQIRKAYPAILPMRPDQNEPGDNPGSPFEKPMFPNLAHTNRTVRSG